MIYAQYYLSAGVSIGMLLSCRCREIKSNLLRCYWKQRAHSNSSNFIYFHSLNFTFWIKYFDNKYLKISFFILVVT